MTPPPQTIITGLLARCADHSITPADFILLARFAKWTHDHDQDPVVCMDILTEDTGLSRSTIFRRLDVLKSKGFLSIEQSELRPDPMLKPVSRYVIHWALICRSAASEHIKQIDTIIMKDDIRVHPRFVKNLQPTSHDWSTAMLEMTDGRTLRFPGQLSEITRSIVQIHSGLTLTDGELRTVYGRIRNASLGELCWLMHRIAARNKIPSARYFTSLLKNWMALPEEKRRLAPRRIRDRATDEKRSPYAHVPVAVRPYSEYLRPAAMKAAAAGRSEGVAPWFAAYRWEEMEAEAEEWAAKQKTKKQQTKKQQVA